MLHRQLCSHDMRIQESALAGIDSAVVWALTSCLKACVGPTYLPSTVSVEEAAVLVTTSPHHETQVLLVAALGGGIRIGQVCGFHQFALPDALEKLFGHQHGTSLIANHATSGTACLSVLSTREETLKDHTIAGRSEQVSFAQYPMVTKFPMMTLCQRW